MRWPPRDRFLFKHQWPQLSRRSHELQDWRLVSCRRRGLPGPYTVTAGLGPFVVLLGQNGADEPDDRVPAGEDADDIGPSAYLFIEALLAV